MGAERCGRDPERIRGRRGARPAGEEPQHLELALREAVCGPRRSRLPASLSQRREVARGAELLENLACGRVFELCPVVVANLPYVTTSEVDARHGSLGYEPRIAVDGGPDGLELLRRLFADLPARAAAGATVLLEIGAGQVEAISALVPPGASVAVVPDLAGLDRVLRIGLAAPR